jgi:hypothetical protein
MIPKNETKANERHGAYSENVPTAWAAQECRALKAQMAFAA